MPTFTRAPDSGAALLTPDQVGQLLVQPVEAASVAMQASTVVTAEGSAFRIPVVTDDPTAMWLDEAAEIPDSVPGTEALVVALAKVAGLVILSREVVDDTSPAAAQVIGDGLARDIARKIDGAYFGALPAPAPSGLAALTGATAVEAPADLTDLDPFAEAISVAETVGAVLTSFVAHPTDGLALSSLKEGSTSVRPLLGADATTATDRRILGVPLLVSPAVTPGTVWGIPRLRTFVVRRFDTRIDRSDDAFFSSDRVAVRGVMRVGFGYPHPAAVVRITRAAPA